MPCDDGKDAVQTPQRASASSSCGLAGSALQSLPSWHGMACMACQRHLPRFIARLREPLQLNELRDRAMQCMNQRSL